MNTVTHSLHSSHIEPDKLFRELCQSYRTFRKFKTQTTPLLKNGPKQAAAAAATLGRDQEKGFKPTIVRITLFFLQPFVALSCSKVVVVTTENFRPKLSEADQLIQTNGPGWLPSSDPCHPDLGNSVVAPSSVADTSWLLHIASNRKFCNIVQLFMPLKP